MEISMPHTCKYCDSIHKDGFMCDGTKLFLWLGGVFTDEEEDSQKRMDYIIQTNQFEKFCNTEKIDWNITKPVKW